MATTNRLQSIRRGTKRYRKALETAYDVTVYSLGNQFRGEPCNALALVRHMSPNAIVPGKLTTSTQSRSDFTLHVHSNCWFEFRADA